MEQKKQAHFPATPYPKKKSHTLEEKLLDDIAPCLQESILGMGIKALMTRGKAKIINLADMERRKQARDARDHRDKRVSQGQW